jgi:sugar-specific transcriptional regulator TrmB
LSQERVYRTLVNFGLTRTDTKVYIYLAKRGSRKGKDLCNSLKMQKQQLYPCLKNLQKKGVVNASCNRPALFYALTFEKVLDLIIEVNKEKAKALQASKEELLSSWKSITEKDDEKS